MRSWAHVQMINTRAYNCACGEKVASDRGWITNDSKWHIHICPSCSRPTLFDEFSNATPGTQFGGSVSNISDENVEKLYEENRRSYSVNSFTNVVLGCRKLLMHIAVSNGAPAGKNFLEYVEFLSNKNIIPTGSKGWVDHIRNKGNEANHEVVIMEKEEAETMLIFSEMLLKMIYEFPARLPKPPVPLTIP